jgi:putative oxidoreductase
MENRRYVSMASIGLLVLRLGIGGYMLTHGWGKLEMLLAGESDKFADPVGLGPRMSLGLAVFAEFFCAGLVMLGLLTRLAAVPLVITMGVAAFVVHGSDPWTAGEAARRFMTGESKSWVSKQPALMYLIVFLALIFTGGGRLSIDGLMAKYRRGPVAGSTVATAEEDLR